MNKIISVAFVILQSAFLACCNGCNQSPAPSYHEAPVKESPKEVLVDTVSEVKQADEEKKDAPVSPASSFVHVHLFQLSIISSFLFAKIVFLLLSSK